MKDLKKKILTSVADDLVAIEKALEKNLKPHFDLVAQTARHILFAGGKRLRPLLMVLAARLTGNNNPDAATLAIVFEYLHAATLLHDDLVDDASVRRGKKVAHKVWGNATAVLVGDFLLARSLTIAADTGKIKILKIIANITENMSQGEIEQLNRKKDLDLSEADYLEVIHYKTAMLIEGACRVGAIFCDASAANENALAQYGYHLGMAFQMADDLLDYTADSEVLGKQAGADLREGKLTLPLIHALQNAGAKDRAGMVDTILKDGFSRTDFVWLLDLLNAYGGIDYTQKKAVAHIEKAKIALLAFEASQTRRLLEDIADYALARQV
jgi:octaprenyl-diphosphate synthase